MAIWINFPSFLLKQFFSAFRPGLLFTRCTQGGSEKCFRGLTTFSVFLSTPPHRWSEIIRKKYVLLSCLCFLLCTARYRGTRRKHQKNLWEIAAGSENSENQKILEILPRIKFCFVCLGIFNFAKKNPEKKFFVYDVTKMKVVYFWGTEILSSRSKGNFDLPSKLLCIPFRRRATCVSKHFLFPSRSHMY